MAMQGDDQPGAVRVALIGALFVIASFVGGKAARDAILLSNFAVTDLPLFVGAAAITSLPIVLLVGRLFARHGPRGLVPALGALSASLLFAEWVLYDYAPKLGAVVVFFHLTLFGAVLVSGFWSIVNERFDARTARRYIGRIGVGATVGGIVGGLIVERASVYLEPSAILLVLAGLQLLCVGLQIALSRGAPPIAPPVAGTTESAALKVVAKTPLLRNLAIMVVLGAIAATALDYVFKARVVEAAGTDGPLRFFAIYYTATNILTALAQIALARVTLERLGVARSIATLPAAVTFATAGALVFPGLASTVIARSSEMIVRSSMYRAAYELIYTPLAEQTKRATKVILDVGGERIGDLLGAQLVGLLLYLAAPAETLLAAGLIAAVVALCFAAALPRNYTRALEQSLEVRLPEAPDEDPGWSTVGLSRVTLTDAGDQTAMSLLDLRSSSLARRIPALAQAPRPVAPRPSVGFDAMVGRISDLRSSDVRRVKAALQGALPRELVPQVVTLLAWDQVAGDATKALRAVVPRCTGMLVDTLLDPMQEFAVRRRLPAILEVGEPALAIWGLRRGLADTRFEVRYRCAKALTHLRAAGHELAIAEPEVFELIERELAVESHVWQSHKLLDPSPHDSDEVLLDNAGTSSRALEHVFTLLGLTLPSSPVRIALQALHTQDRVLRATALEYIESVLPAPLRAMLWPHLESANEDEEDDALAVLIPTLSDDPAAWPKLKATMESALFEMIAQPGFLDRNAPSLETRKALVDAILRRLSEDNYRRLHRYLEFQKTDPRAQFISWLRTEAKRVGRAHLRGVAAEAEAEETHGEIESRPREEIAADLLLSRPSVVAMLEGQNKK
jgi:AAA family ATP:ADP antiporter